MTADAAKDAKVLEEVIMFLNRVGHGNAVKWFKELNVLEHQAKVLERFTALLDTMIGTLSRMKAKLGSVLPDSFIARMDAWGKNLNSVKEMGAKMIPEGIKELHAQLLRLQQLVYKGEWHV